MIAAAILLCLGMIGGIWLDIASSAKRKPYRDDLTFDEFNLDEHELHLRGDG